MKIINEQFVIPKDVVTSPESLKEHLESKIELSFPASKPIRFFVIQSSKSEYICEVDLIVFERDTDVAYFGESRSIFDHQRRSYEDVEEFIAALVIPTGIGAEIGGHCGDGSVASRLIASACDTLITHPNVVNASDINEMTENTLYVEGGVLTEFFNGMIGLQKVRSNRILMLMDQSDDIFFNNEIVNAVSSARVTLGIDCDVVEMKSAIDADLKFTESGRAAAEIRHFDRLLKTISVYKDNYDAVGLATIVQIPEEESRAYFASVDNVVNPWGGSEAIITHSVSAAFGKPAAHSPLSVSMGDLHLDYGLGIVDPRKAPESASVAYLHCILKGLHRAPRIVDFEKGINIENVSCLIIPDGCIGLPVLAALSHGIPVIAVKNNNLMNNDLSELPFMPGKLFYAENYMEATGIITALKAGISLDTLRRPIRPTRFFESSV